MEITDDDKILYITDFIQFSRPLAVEFNGTRESSNLVFFFFFCDITLSIEDSIRGCP